MEKLSSSNYCLYYSNASISLLHLHLLCSSQPQFLNNGGSFIKHYIVTWYFQLCSHQASLFTITGNQTLCIIEYLLKMKTIANSLIAATQPISQEDFVLAYSCWISTKHDSFINSVTTHGEPISADDLHQWRSHMVPREKWKPKQS